MDLALLASLAALLVGPLVLERTRGPWALAFVDAFALVAVGGLVGAHVLPQSFRLAGWVSAPVLLLGWLGPGLLCGSRFLTGQSGSRVTLPVALLGIVLHALLDGVALSTLSSGLMSPLALAVVLHRVSDGLGIWWLARPHYGRPVASFLLATLAAATVVGFAFAQPIAQGVSHRWFGLFQALVAGSLLHVILRHPPSTTAGIGPSRGLGVASGVGGLAGIALVLSLEGFVHDAGHEQVATRFVELALESAPALLAAYVAVALLAAWELDLRSLLGRGGKLAQALRGTLLGLPMPICSCGVIPLYRGLVLQGVPTTAALSFLIAAPELGVTALFLSWSLLGGELTLARALSAGMLALLVGLLVGPRASLAEHAGAAPERHVRLPFPQRLRAGVRYGLGDMVDATAPWIVVGLLLAAVLEPWLGPEHLGQLPAALEVPLFALLGMPLYVCASGSTPLAAVLIAQGISPGATLALLLTGPATNVTTFGVLARLHSRHTALVFAATVAVSTTLLGWGVNLLLPDAAAGLPERPHDHGSVFQLACALLLLVLTLLSLLRQGTRGFVSQVISPHRPGAPPHDHDHAEGCGHEGEDAAEALRAGAPPPVAKDLAPRRAIGEPAP